MNFPKPKKVAYVVIEGRMPGIYETWNEAKAQVDGIRDACYRGYFTYEAAIEVWEAWEYHGENRIRAKTHTSAGRPKVRAKTEAKDRLPAIRAEAQWLVKNFSGPNGRGEHLSVIK
jgi:viroplasmin and RNaseH domain-containing protein